ncbi:MAG TPA: hypothetical protein VGC29_01820 [Flavisolibacter sp.]
MQKQIFPKGSILLLILALAVVLLATAGSFLYSQNMYYKKANRELIIQNDSIISVNIKLKSALNGNMKSASKASFEFMKERN